MIGLLWRLQNVEAPAGVNGVNGARTPQFNRLNVVVPSQHVFHNDSSKICWSMLDSARRWSPSHGYPWIFWWILLLSKLSPFDRKVAQRRMFERIDFIARRQDRFLCPPCIVSCGINNDDDGGR